MEQFDLARGWQAMPLAKLCKLALLWNEAGSEKEASELSSWLLTLESFPSLWCPEKQFNEREIQSLFSKIRNFKPTSFKNPDVDLTLIETKSLMAALTLEGDGTSLGAIRGEGFEIRALGPQDEALRFGIRGKGMDGWACTAADPEIWIELKYGVEEEGIELKIRFCGIKKEKPMFFAFYIQAAQCQIEDITLKPKKLHRFQGEARGAVFDERWEIKAAQIHKVQAIPLAGEECFWGSDFLLAFEIHPLISQNLFLIKRTTL